MRPSLRFLALVTIGWAGARAYSLGALPAGSLELIGRSEAKPAPALVPTEFPTIEPMQPGPEQVPYAPAAYAPQSPMPPVQMRPIAVPVYYGVSSVRVPLPAAEPAPQTNWMPEPRRPAYVQAASDPDEYPISRLASLGLAQARSSPVPMQSTPMLAAAANKLDRWQVAAWALVRNQQAGVSSPSSLAGSGNLGGSQAGARLTYAFDRRLAASLRTSSNIGQRGFEVAAGVRVQPLASLPVWVTAERRQRVGAFGGRNAFAVFAETGLYHRPLPWQFSFDTYLQGGIVGLKSRDLFVDGALAITRPVYKSFSAGFGVWGGAQPGLYRVDVGPRVSMRVRKNVSVHFDYRQRLAGNAMPGSGPTITLGADF